MDSSRIEIAWRFFLCLGQGDAQCCSSIPATSKKKWSQDHLALVTRFHQTFISLTERSAFTPNTNQLQRLADALDVDEPAHLLLPVTVTLPDPDQIQPVAEAVKG